MLGEDCQNQPIYSKVCTLQIAHFLLNNEWVLYFVNSASDCRPIDVFGMFENDFSLHRRNPTAVAHWLSFTLMSHCCPHLCSNGDIMPLV